VIGNVAYQPLFVLGLDHSTAGNSAIILASTPALVALFSHLAGHERLEARAWAGVALSMAGLVLVVTGGSAAVSLATGAMLGNALTFGAALAWSLYTVLGRPIMLRHSAETVTSGALLLAAPILGLLAVPALRAQDWGRVTALGWLGLAASALLAICLAYLVWGYAVARLGSSRTAVYANLIPVVAAATGAIFLGERLGLLQIGGAGLVFAGIALTRQSQP
jgi:drug/metabolite transporter (DMT)-like permease